MYIYVCVLDYPQLTVFADKANHSRQEYASLTCNIDSINGPFLSYFEWKKNNEFILSSEDANLPLTLETTDTHNPFGEFECIVSNGLVTNSARILISESGIAVVKIETLKCPFYSFCYLRYTVQIRYILRPISTTEKCVR